MEDMGKGKSKKMLERVEIRKAKNGFVMQMFHKPEQGKEWSYNDSHEEQVFNDHGEMMAHMAKMWGGEGE